MPWQVKQKGPIPGRCSASGRHFPRGAVTRERSVQHQRKSQGGRGNRDQQRGDRHTRAWQLSSPHSQHCGAPSTSMMEGPLSLHTKQSVSPSRIPPHPPLQLQHLSPLRESLGVSRLHPSPDQGRHSRCRCPCSPQTQQSWTFPHDMPWLQTHTTECDSIVVHSVNVLGPPIISNFVLYGRDTTQVGNHTLTMGGRVQLPTP